MKRYGPVVFLIVIAVCAGCRGAPPKLLHEVVWLPPANLFALDYFLIGDKKDDPDRLLSNHFGVTVTHYGNIYDGLKPLRVALLLKGEEFIFEIQTDGDIELAKKGYGKRMQFRITFFSPRPLRDFRIITTGSMEEALLLSGDVGDVKVLLDQNGKAISARQESHYRVEARLRLEIDRDKLRIYVPEEAIPQSARHCWSPDKAAFEWDLRVGLALEPLDPIPTNVPGLYFVPGVYRIWYPKDRCSYERFPPLWSVVRASDASKKEPEDKTDSAEDKRKQ